MHNWNSSLNKILVFHHNDQDGYVAAAAVAHAVKKNLLDFSMRFIECNYGFENWKEIIHTEDLNNTLVCIVDFSIPMEEMRYLCDKIGSQNVVWIDHHVSIINTYIDNFGPELSLIPGFRISTGLCAAELTFLYFSVEHSIQPISSKNLLVIDGKEYHTEIKEERDALIAKYMYPGLKLCGDWDVWRHVETPDNRDAIALNHYFNSKDKLCPIDNDYEVTYFSDGRKEDIYTANDIVGYTEEDIDNEDDSENILQKKIDEGLVIDNYLTITSAKAVKINAYKCMIVGFEDINAIAMNWGSNFSSTVFASVADKYEVGILYSFNGKRVIYSFYRLNQNPERIINCSAIAKVWGGGGHMSAAGCKVKKDTEVIRVVIKK